MSEIDTYIGARLRAAREAADLSVRDVARQLGTDPDRLAR
ncbi:MAG: helix-turn-helix domain-containing protein, partial [Chloroflexi bacterium]|nr:helix-turn-helix domain-containing protein [Chloroflexota bacterium]